ncbi:Abscisic acid-responsive TB2/DP1, HVA22 family protein [Prunus dulcis]|uniref:HVA22-like protein n=1 Tax=Prunus dulcis TaxID=3755 RepID=A0A4Y1QSI5_PRUDU|nr:Abscisic acid-responsive TB2/DP1, HVA22 family protein [Prunus dulcis]
MIRERERERESVFIKTHRIKSNLIRAREQTKQTNGNLNGTNTATLSLSHKSLPPPTSLRVRRRLSRRRFRRTAIPEQFADSMVLGYAYPAYECYKTVEKNKPEIEQLRFWCQILVAVLTVCERIGDALFHGGDLVPMYSEAKLLFIIYLWFPKTKGTTYVYDSFFRPYLAKHENEIDRNLLELRTRAGDIAVVYWQRAASYGQTRIFDILQYVAAQSTPRPRPAQWTVPVPALVRVVLDSDYYIGCTALYYSTASADKVVTLLDIAATTRC